MDMLESANVAAQVEAVGGDITRAVQVMTSTMRIHDLSIDDPNVVAYLQTIAPEKQEIALVHAIEVGITELLSRRARFRREP
jgi:hypothetical protein